MDLFIPDIRLDQLIFEDVPYLDLTTEVLGIQDLPGSIEYFTREPCVLCCTEEVTRMMSRLGVTVTKAYPSGACLEAGEAFLWAHGSAGRLHKAWKVCLSMFDHYSAVATKTRGMVDAARAVNPHCEMLTTRKSMPGAKDLLTKAVMTGGAWPHRLGLSETVLVFDKHLEFLGGLDAFIKRLPEYRARCIEKKLYVEVAPEEAIRVARAGVDGVQLDKVSTERLRMLVPELKATDPRLAVIAAGGIDPSNVAAYAATGVDGVATTSPFTAKPIDMSVRMVREDGR